MTDAWNIESNWMEELEALNHPNVTYEHLLVYLQARHDNVEQLVSEWDFHQYMSAKEWYARFTFKTPNPHPFPPMSNVVSNINPLSNFKVKFDLWYQQFNTWAVAEGYDMQKPELAPDKRRRAIDPTKLTRIQEAERVRGELNLAKLERDEAERRYSQLTRDAQQAMMDIVNERNSLMPTYQDRVRRLKEEYRIAKAAV